MSNAIDGNHDGTWNSHIGYTEDDLSEKKRVLSWNILSLLFFTKPKTLSKTHQFYGSEPNYFVPCSDKPFVATPAALEVFTREEIIECLCTLQHLAKEKGGIDYLQVFSDEIRGKLWFLEDGEGGAITAMLPSDY